MSSRGTAAPPRTLAWRERLIAVDSAHYGRTPVNAAVYGRLAVHQVVGGSGYALTHVPSGQAVVPWLDTAAEARCLAERLAHLDWSFKEPDTDSVRYCQTVAQATTIIRAWLAERRAMTAAVREAVTA